MSKPEPKVGQIWRDTYADNPKTGYRNGRTICVKSILPYSVSAVVLTDTYGNVLARHRETAMQTKTLRAGYELAEEAP